MLRSPDCGSAVRCYFSMHRKAAFARLGKGGFYTDPLDQKSYPCVSLNPRISTVTFGLLLRISTSYSALSSISVTEGMSKAASSLTVTPVFSKSSLKAAAFTSFR